MPENHPSQPNPESRTQNPLSPTYYEEDTLSLTDILLVLAINLRILVIIPFIFCVVTIVYVLFFANPVYTATAKIIPTSGGESISELRGLAAQFGVTVPGGEKTDISSAAIYPEIIKSRTLARTLLKRKFDTHEFGSQKQLLQILTYGNDEPELGLDTLMKMGIETLTESMIEVSKDRESFILTVGVSAFEPQFAADLAMAVIEELDRFQRKIKLQRISEKRKFIQDRIVAVQTDLEKAEDALKQFRERNRQIASSPALLLDQERLAREMEVQKNIFITLKQQLELAKIKEVEEASMVQVLDVPEAPLDRSKPKRKRAVLLAGILGIGLGIFIAFIREYIGKRDGEEKEKMTQFQLTFIRNLQGLIPGKSRKRKGGTR